VKDLKYNNNNDNNNNKIIGSKIINHQLIIWLNDVFSVLCSKRLLCVYICQIKELGRKKDENLALQR